MTTSHEDQLDRKKKKGPDDNGANDENSGEEPGPLAGDYTEAESMSSGEEKLPEQEQ